MRNRPLTDTYSGKRVFITGHTGFKGSWLVAWLEQLGAKVGGYALDPELGAELLFSLVSDRLTLDCRADIRDPERIQAAVSEFQPDFVFHLAAQAQVRESYRDPVGTVATNVDGTANLLNAIRFGAPGAHTVIVTSDKCYENREWVYPYREIDALGGHDLYSASKACAELVSSAFRRSFFECENVPGRVTTARGGNVIGGGDFAVDRILPDAIRALHAERTIGVRNPGATRPWQHVLDCLSGYLELGIWLAGPEPTQNLERAFNFGPATDCERSVQELVKQILRDWPGMWEDQSDPGAEHEAGRLRIAIDQAGAVLGWKPTWYFEKTVKKTVDWYRLAATNNQDSDSLRKLIREQIRDFEMDMETREALA